MGRDAVPAAHGHPLAARLERLFAATHPPHAIERPWRASEVVAACREQGYDLSETNLSELRRGRKTNPTMRTLHALSWFFEIGVSYFTDFEVDPALETQLAAREADLSRHIQLDQTAREEAADATRDLQRALRAAGAAGVAHRGFDTVGLRERTQMMRALTDALTNEPDDPDDPDGPDGGAGA